MAKAESNPKIEKLRDKWNAAVERDKVKDALAALIELEKLDLTEPRWSHRLGDTYRRLGQHADAEQAWERAMAAYAKHGFLARAVAMAKTIVTANPKRTDVMAKIDQEGARSLRADQLAAKLSHPTQAATLQRAKNAETNEIRFEDSKTPSELALTEADVGPPPLITDDDLIDIDIAFDETAAPSAQRLAAMGACTLFASLPKAALEQMTSAAELITVEPGELLIKRDDPADSLFALVEGAARVAIPGMADGGIRLNEGEVCGESCLLDEGVRQGDVKAESTLVALKIPKAALDDIVSAHKEVETVLFQLLVRRLIGNAIQTSELFAAFDRPTRLELSNMFEVRRAETGVVFAERGKRSDGLYLILAGDLVAQDETGKASRLERGTMFGQGSLISQASATHTIKSITEAIVLRLPAARFSAFAMTYPPALSHLSDLAAREIAPPQRHVT